MSIKVDIFHPRLKQLMGSTDSVRLNGNTVGECLNHLVKQFPGTEKWLFNEQGQLLKHVYVYVNAESAYKAELDAPVKEGDKLLIAALITGG